MIKSNEHARTAKVSVVGGTGIRYDILEWVLAKVGPECELTFLRIHLQCRRFDSWVREICWRRDRLPTKVFLGFPCGSAGKEATCSVGDLGSIPGLGRSPGEGKGYPLQYSGLENSMDCIVHGVTKSWTRLSDFHFISLQSCFISSCLRRENNEVMELKEGQKENETERAHSVRKFISLCWEWLEHRGEAWGNVNQSHYTKDLTVTLITTGSC